MKRFRWLIWLCLGLILAGAVAAVAEERQTDLKLGLITDKSCGLVSMSFQRMMVNSLEVEGETLLWVPEGLGWYQADKIKRLLIQEDRQDLADDILFYNFGFAADEVIYVGQFDDWLKRLNLIKLMGLVDWLRFEYQGGRMIFKDEKLNGQLGQNGPFLDKVMPRDFADSLILTEAVRATVVNTTDFDGLANFVAERLSWLGMLVTEARSGDEEVEGCKIVLGRQATETETVKVLKQVLNCQFEVDEALAGAELEIYLGDEFGEMLNYDAYVRTF